MNRSSDGALLLVGGTGRTGRILASHLLERGVACRALVRDAATARTVLGQDVGLVEGDLRDPGALATAAKGCNRVVFLAAATGDPSRGMPYEIDYGAAASLIGLLDASRIAHFVMLSSAGVTQPEHPHNCTFNGVLKWKLAAEKVLRGSRLPYTIVRALGLRDRPPSQSGIRIVQGDRIAFGEDIARGDVAAFLADVVAPGSTTGFARDFDSPSLLGATCEIYNDGTTVPGCWVSAKPGLDLDERALYKEHAS